VPARSFEFPRKQSANPTANAIGSNMTGSYNVQRLHMQGAKEIAQWRREADLHINVGLYMRSSFIQALGMHPGNDEHWASSGLYMNGA
jgi:hypothetical protein